MIHLLEHLRPLATEVVPLRGCPRARGGHEGAQHHSLRERGLLPPRKCRVADPHERILQTLKAMLENEVALAVRPVDRVQVGLMEDVLGRLALRVRAVLVEAPDVRRLFGGSLRVAPRLQVALRDEVLLPVLGDRCTPLWLDCGYSPSLWLILAHLSHRRTKPGGPRNPPGFLNFDGGRYWT